MCSSDLAISLIKKFETAISEESFDSHLIIRYSAKQCALIAVKELIEDNRQNEDIVNGGLNLQYWQEVKTELNKLS